MKLQKTLRNDLYRTLDDFIRFCNRLNREITTISLTVNQFEIFKDFNTIIDGSYWYRGIKIRVV